MMNVERIMDMLTDTPVSSARIAGKSLFKRIWEQKGLQGMAIPGVIWMLVFSYIPMYGLMLAFKEYSLGKSLFGGAWIGFKYFREFFQDEYFFRIIENTLGISLLRIVIGFPIPIIFAILVNEIMSSRYKRTVQTITYLPHFISWAVLGGLMISWLSEAGAFNAVLLNLGIIKEPIAFIAEPKYFWGIVLISNIWKETGWNTIIYLAAIASIDQEMFESANLDGVNRFQKIWYLILPSISGTIAVLFILNVGYLLNTNFDQILVMSNQVNLDRSNVIDLYVFRTGIRTGRFSYATAIGALRSVVALLLLVIADRGSKKVAGQSIF